MHFFCTSSLSAISTQVAQLLSGSASSVLPPPDAAPGAMPGATISRHFICADSQPTPPKPTQSGSVQKLPLSPTIFRHWRAPATDPSRMARGPVGLKTRHSSHSTVTRVACVLARHRLQNFDGRARHFATEKPPNAPVKQRI